MEQEKSWERMAVAIWLGPLEEEARSTLLSV